MEQVLRRSLKGILNAMQTACLIFTDCEPVQISAYRQPPVFVVKDGLSAWVIGSVTLIGPGAGLPGAICRCN